MGRVKDEDKLEISHKSLEISDSDLSAVIAICQYIAVASNFVIGPDQLAFDVQVVMRFAEHVNQLLDYGNANDSHRDEC